MAAKDVTAVRLDERTRVRIEALREPLSTEWRKATFSEALRAALTTGLDALEQEKGANDA